MDLNGLESIGLDLDWFPLTETDPIGLDWIESELIESNWIELDWIVSEFQGVSEFRPVPVRTAPATMNFHN